MNTTLTHKYNLQQWAKNILALTEFVIIDTETTGLGDDAEIIEIAVINRHGDALLHTFVKPERPIPTEATLIHGITDNMVKHAPEWIFVKAELDKILTSEQYQGKYNALMYNANFDERMIQQTNRRQSMTDSPIRAIDLMQPYAEYHGELHNGEPGKYKWQKLSNAAQQLGIELTQPAHRALVDCHTTLAVLESMAYNPISLPAPAPTAANTTSYNHDLFKQDLGKVLHDIQTLLIDKNRKYGDSALNPIRIFSQANPLEQINVRIDDKLSRLRNQQHDEDEDVAMDLTGYLIMKMIAQMRMNGAQK